MLSKFEVLCATIGELKTEVANNSRSLTKLNVSERDDSDVSEIRVTETIHSNASGISNTWNTPPNMQASSMQAGGSRGGNVSNNLGRREQRKKNN